MRAQIEQRKSLIDYVDMTTTFPMSHSTLYTGQLLLLLKLIGELPNTPWKMPLLVWGLGIILTLLRAWSRKADAESSQRPHPQLREG